ncbi:MAG: S-methyl-5-thioribose-1-phosphate isomerase [Magnetococcales bacterium]|nr:S-methyl-5-thioribose-1-phosphate isomerase [Magnetococcales bacterium]NGZ05020.1 S-methyl-5-thioribose-1-phosphate isomerase [Magnetococcales bacterium]
MTIFDVAVWSQGRVRMLDQRRLPNAEIYHDYGSAAEVAEAIRAMVVRGAPAIGCAAAFGVAVEAFRVRALKGVPDSWVEAMAPGLAQLRQARPTAVNLGWALDRMAPLLLTVDPEAVPERLLAEAEEIRQEDIAACRAMGALGAAILPAPPPDRPLAILTHCNAGALATAGYGTALGVIRAARARFGRVVVYATETRPYLQGARLTAWELRQDGFDVTLMTDSMTGHAMHCGRIDVVVVGADRVAANGDAANKIGTYMHAVLARRHAIPFLVACPLSTIDLATASGDHIPIEERSPTEVTHWAGQPVAADGVRVFNPAFDVTPAELISALVTERGVVQPPNESAIRALFGSLESLPGTG